MALSAKVAGICGVWVALLLPAISVRAQNYTLLSPGGVRECQVWVERREVVLVSKARAAAEADTFSIGFELAGVPVAYRHARQATQPVKGLYRTSPHAPQRHLLNAQLMRIGFSGNRQLHLLLADDGLAYRWQIAPHPTHTAPFTIEERLHATLAAGAHVLSGIQPNPDGSFEDTYTRMLAPQDLPAYGHLFLPAVARYSRGQSLLITEADLHNYPLMLFTRGPRVDSVRHQLQAVWQRYPLRDSLWSPRNYERVPSMRLPYMALLRPGEATPWRCFAYVSNDKQLAYNPFSALVTAYSLGSNLPPAPATYPGLAQWGWWHHWNVPGLSFKTGINTQTYAYYIDYAASRKLPYVLMDDGWADAFNPDQINPAVDMPALLARAREKNVKLIVWALWHKLDEQPEYYLKKWAAMGIAGVKVDFINRADQRAIQSAERICALAERFGLVLEFHGFAAPMGLQMRYPCLLTTEGVLGNEYNKVTRQVTPRHQVNIVFVRGNGGPFDYTPGAMTNRTQAFAISDAEPMSQGSLSGEVAKFVLYDSPLQMVCDAPTRYQAQPEVEKLITGMPTVWDTTIVLEARLNSHLLVARRRGTRWYVGGLNGAPHDVVLQVRFSFLKKPARLALLTDGVNTDRIGSDYQFARQPVNPGQVVTVRLVANGGGAVLVTE